jgi:hypothetical protein
MSKKLFTTLLPIATVALLGGGIVSSLTLTSCGKSKIIFRSKTDVDNYLLKHSSSGMPDTFYYEVSSDEDNGRLPEAEVDRYHSYLLPIFTRQNLINSILYVYSNGSSFPITLSDNKNISGYINVEGKESYFNLSVISYTSLDAFSCFQTLGDDFEQSQVTTAFNIVFHRDYGNQLWWNYEENGFITTISPHDFSKITYEPIESQAE